ncbi:hypothetical protein C4577_07465 [Candidatus Parcubacteria bacterium]|nr:MAG: hypothetical protein C4577_07465 [Candidatus Parcubacteria bacterium]
MLDLSQIRQKTNKLLHEREFAAKQVELEKAALEKIENKLKDLTEVQEILQLHAEAVQNRAQKQISSIATQSLKHVYGPNVEFRIEFKRSKGKTEAELKFIKDGQEFDPKEETGGGELDVASLALRMSCLMLSRPRLRRLIVADEPFRNINGEEYQQRAGNLIQLLAEEMKVQFVVVSDDEWLKVGNVIDMSTLKNKKLHQ